MGTAPSRRRVSSAFLFLTAVFAVLMILTGVRTAQAAGNVKLKSQTIEESGGAWHLFMTLQLSAAPPTAHQSMKFIFTKTAAYEMDLVDGKDQPVANKQALAGQLPTIEPQDVDFSDGTGKIYNKTVFDFSVSRSRNYGPGEYILQVKLSDGTEIGGKQVLVLNRTTDPNDANGKIDIIDRRSISFDANSKTKKIDNGSDAGAKATTQGESATPMTGDVAASGSAAPFIPDSAYQPTLEEQGKDHPKGCGCSVLGRDPLAGGNAYASLGLFGLGIVVVAGRARTRAKRAKRSGSLHAS